MLLCLFFSTELASQYRKLSCPCDYQFLICFYKKHVGFSFKKHHFFMIFQKCMPTYVYLTKNIFPIASCLFSKLWKILKEMGIPDHLTCLLRNLYAGQEPTVRIGWFKIGKGVFQGYILSPCLFN